MQIAFEEHQRCAEYPKVGAVVSKNGELLSTGYRGEKVGVHAERTATEKLCENQLINSTLFTTLEPCVNLIDKQPISSCADLIVQSGIKKVIIGILDPNGTIYSQGYKKLLESQISVSFFNRKLRLAIEDETFDYGDVSVICGHGKRRIPVTSNVISMDVKFSNTDDRTIKIYWSTLQFNSGTVDLASNNGAVRLAKGASKFSDITDPLVFRFPSHLARMKVDSIAVVKPEKATFCVLIKVIEIYENDILFQWQVRNEE